MFLKLYTFGVIATAVLLHCCPGVAEDKITMPFARQGEFVFLPVQMEGRSLIFILDTGSSHYVVDLSLATLLGEPINTGKTTSGVKIQLFKPPGTFKAGGVIRRVPTPVIGHDLTHVELLTGAIDGIIGVDFVFDRISQFDFKKRVFRQMQSNEGHTQLGESIPLRWERNAFWMEAHVGDERIVCKLDTGSSSEINITAGKFDKLVESTRISSVERSPALSFASTRVTRSGVVDSVSLGGMEIRNVAVGEFSENTIGIGFLSRFETVTIDGPSSRLHLQQSPETDKTRYQNLSGIRVVWSGTHILIHSLANDSPGSRSGLQSGDVLLKANGKSLNLGQIRLLLRSKPNKTIELLVSRNDVLMTHRLKLLERKNWRN